MAFPAPVPGSLAWMQALLRATVVTGDAGVIISTSVCYGAPSNEKIGVDSGFGVIFVHYSPPNPPLSPNPPSKS